MNPAWCATPTIIVTNTAEQAAVEDFVPFVSCRRSHPAQRHLQRVRKDVCLGQAEGHWWLDLQHVVEGTISRDQDAVLAHVIGNEAGFFRGRIQVGPVLHQFHAEEQAFAAYMPDKRVLLRHGLNPEL